jgi:DNA repair protein RadC
MIFMPLTDINIYTLKQVRSQRRRYDFEGQRITSPSVCYTTLESILNLQAEPVEKFGIIALNVKKEINGIHIIGSGIVNRALVEPREVFMAALMNNASAIIAFHNHTSGDPSHSPADIMLTKRLRKAGDILGIAVVDHLITGEGKYISLRKEKLL